MSFTLSTSSPTSGPPPVPFAGTPALGLIVQPAPATIVLLSGPATRVMLRVFAYSAKGAISVPNAKGEVARVAAGWTDAGLFEVTSTPTPIPGVSSGLLFEPGATFYVHASPLDGPRRADPSLRKFYGDFLAYAPDPPPPDPIGVPVELDAVFVALDASAVPGSYVFQVGGP